MNEKIKCLLVEPYKLPKEIEIENNLKSFQKQVNGYIETTYLQDDNEVVLICNEEGKMNNMELNRYIGYDIIAGPFLIVGDDYENGNFKSLTNVQIEKYKKYFNENSIAKTLDKIYEILSSRKNHKEMER